MKAILLVSHGSRSSRTKEEVIVLLERIRRMARADIFEHAFLEIETPNIPQGIDLCAAKGATEVVLLLNFLNSGQHVDRDIPFIVKQAQSRYPALRFKVTPPVGQHPGIAFVFQKMIDSV